MFYKEPRDTVVPSEEIPTFPTDILPSPDSSKVQGNIAADPAANNEDLVPNGQPVQLPPQNAHNVPEEAEARDAPGGREDQDVVPVQGVDAEVGNAPELNPALELNPADLQRDHRPMEKLSTNLNG
ncbi:hypothetical protein R1sor_000257 [Riccia sorocarpa]|uniref:Uncharacterized protein n=1 Tax=Riccia sorocarpa TaxID=122646 RepID=A0ABD3GVR1_9MARC